MLHRRIHAACYLIALLAVLAAILTAPGCQLFSPTASAEAKWAQARDALTTAQRTTLTRHQAGELSDATLQAIDPYVQQARAILDLAEAQLPEGGPSFDDLIREFERVLDAEIERRLQQEQSHALLGNPRRHQARDHADPVFHAAGRAGPAEGTDHRRAVRSGQAAGPGDGCGVG